MRMHLLFFSLVPGARTLIFHLDIVIVDILYDQASLNSDFTGRFFNLYAASAAQFGQCCAVKALISSIPFRKVVVVLNTCKPFKNFDRKAAVYIRC